MKPRYNYAWLLVALIVILGVALTLVDSLPK